MIITTDDLCLCQLKNFEYFDKLKEKYPKLIMTAFAIANHKNNELLVGSDIFKDWYQKHKDWVEIGVHSYDHEYPPDGDREDEEHWIKKALDSLRPFLRKEYGYRSPGFQTTNKTVPALRKYGFRYIAYETMIKDLKTGEIQMGVLNSHIYDIGSINRLEVRLNEVLQY